MPHTDQDDRSRLNGRPSAEEMLDRLRREAGSGARGRHRVYVGIAPGVGKTFTALEELQRRKTRGTDAVIAYVETYNRPRTVAAIGDLEIVPRCKIAYRGVLLEDMDTDAVLRRNPAVALLDELAHSNAPGSKHEKRWQDLVEMLDAGITVISTVNVQHLESLADIVESITGIKVQERIPDRILDEADEVELVDMSPHALRQRLRHGNVYPEPRAKQALESFFREGNLIALRELAMRKVAGICEQDLEEYMRAHEVESVWPAGERVMVCVDAAPRTQDLLRRGWRMAGRYQSDLVAAYVETPASGRASVEEKRAVQENLRFAEDLGAAVVRITDGDIASGLMSIALEHNVGSIVIGHSHHGRVHDLLRGSVVHDLLRLATGVDVHVAAEREAR